MAVQKIYSAQVQMLKGEIISIETDISRGLHAFSIVGLPDKAVEESKDRVGAAIKNSGFPSPKSQNQKIIISLSPADVKKEGSYFDLGIALSYLLAHESILFDPQEKLFLGELGLDGSIRPLKGVLTIIQEAKEQGFKEIYIPKENSKEASLISGITIFGVETLSEVISHLLHIHTLTPILKTEIEYSDFTAPVDMADIKGQESAKRGLLIAAAGGHNIALVGSPGTGKTMLARAFSGILPFLPEEQVLEVTGIHSIVGLGRDLIVIPPFRAPHHTASYVSIVGGGATPKPGEVTLSHRGVLFLDEFPEFDKRVLESLRQPLEDKVVSVSRAKGSALFPSSFILIAAMNPCPCGYLLSSVRRCSCSQNDVLRYRRKLSGPIVDRIDIWISVPEVSYDALHTGEVTEKQNTVFREKVSQARLKQKLRFEAHDIPFLLNSDMNSRLLETCVPLKSEVEEILKVSAERLLLSARAYHRVIKLARTIADLEGSSEVEVPHILEAIQYRPKIN